jgi:predicted nucleic acid-binding protein
MTTRSGPALLVVDTDLLIDYLRDQPQAVAFLESTEQPLATSVITVAELYAGVRDGEERQRLDTFVASFDVLTLDRQPAQRAGLWRRQYGPSHGTGLAVAPPLPFTTPPAAVTGFGHAPTPRDDRRPVPPRRCPCRCGGIRR